MCKLAFENRMFNSFGKIFTVTTFGESHGPAIGVVVDGVPAGFAFDLPFIQSELDRRKPGQSSLTTSRSEEDQIEVLSGVFENKTTGAPVAMLVRNMDAKSGDYTEIRKILRPGHADLTYFLKYGTRDPNGGGRASARETLARVAAGALAKSILNQWKNIQILAWVSEVYTIKAMVNPAEVTLEMVEENPVRCPDPIAATKIETLITETKKEGNSLGGIITCKTKEKILEKKIDQKEHLLDLKNNSFMIKLFEQFEQFDPYNEEIWDEKIDYSQEQGVCFNCGSGYLDYEDNSVIKNNEEVWEYTCDECGSIGQERWILTKGNWNSRHEIQFLINEKK